MKHTSIAQQPNGLCTITTVEITIVNDVPLLILPPVVAPAPAPAPLPAPPPEPAPLWKMATDFSLLPLGVLARQTTGITEAFTNTKIATSPDGRHCAKVAIDAADTGFGKWGGIIAHPTALSEGNEIRFKMDVFFPATFDYRAGGVGLKTLRIHTESDAGVNQGYMDMLIAPSGLLVAGNEVLGTVAKDLGSAVRKGVWETFEMYVRFDSRPGYGVQRIWQNGVLVYENLTQKTLASPTSRSNRSYVFTYWNDGAPATQGAYIDNVSVVAR